MISKYKITKYAGCFVAAVSMLSAMALQSCDRAEEPGKIPDGYVQVNFRVTGSYGSPLTDTDEHQKQISTTRIAKAPIKDIYDATPYPIPDGTTLWLLAQKTDANGTATTGEQIVKSYVVQGGTLLPCNVDDDGNLLNTTAAPLYLEHGEYYRFKALGPARKLIDGQSLYIKNGEYVIANDDRDRFNSGLADGRKTGSIVRQITETAAGTVNTIDLNPLINQTARLKFTIYSDDGDPAVHSLGWQVKSVEIGGVQNYYAQNNKTGKAYNWTVCTPADTLIAYPSDKNEILELTNLTSNDPQELVCETGILPTDAFAEPMTVLFNVKVNGVPTTLETMLNRKIFLAGYSYNYRGRVKIEGKVTVLEWQSITWSQDIPIL